MDNLEQGSCKVLRVFAVLAVLLALSEMRTGAQNQPAVSPETKPATKQFVLIFRTGDAKPTEEEQKRRNGEAREWALRLRKEGRTLDPRILDEGGAVVASDGEQSVAPKNSSGKVGAVIFIEANDLNEVVAMAKAHPALKYGVTIEVRPWVAK
jgi:hypothetical protein